MIDHHRFFKLTKHLKTAFRPKTQFCYLNAVLIATSNKTFIKVIGEFECVIIDFSFVWLVRNRRILNEIVFDYYVVSIFFLDLEIFSPFEEEKKF